MRIFLFSDDVNLLAHWEKAFTDNCTVIYELEELKSLHNQLLILNYSALETQQKEILRLLEANNNKVLVLHRTPDIQTARKVLEYGGKGYGNALMKEHFLQFAIESIKDGMVWLHPEFISQLIAQIPSKEDKDLSAYFVDLTQREEEVAICLKDGDSYKTIAQKLEITPRTVKAHAHNVYAKLHVKDRLDLALLLK